MLHDPNITQVEPLTLMRELISSVRDIGKRLDELKMVLKEDLCAPEKKHIIIDRIKKLNETKFELIFSVYDIRKQFVDAVGDGTGTVRESFSAEGLYSSMKQV